MADNSKTRPPHEAKTGQAAQHAHTTDPAQPVAQVTTGGSGAVPYGKHATMPVLQSDLYRDVVIPSLTEFTPDEIKLDGTLVAVGQRRTGKSWCYRNIMYLMKDKIPAGIVISQTDPLNKFWQQYVPK
eukprot:1285374-Prymnesium_polylepis.1